MNRKDAYASLDKWKDTCRKQKQRYYGKTQIYSDVSKKCKWTYEEDMKILRHEKSDHELASELKRSVRAIQVRRCRLKKPVSPTNRLHKSLKGEKEYV